MFLWVVLAMLECGKCGIQGLCTHSCYITPVQGTRATRHKRSLKLPKRVTLSPSLPLRCAQGFGSLKGKLREGSDSLGTEILPLRYAQGFGSRAQDDMRGWTVSVALDMKLTLMR